MPIITGKQHLLKTRTSLCLCFSNFLLRNAFSFVWVELVAKNKKDTVVKYQERKKNITHFDVLYVAFQKKKITRENSRSPVTEHVDHVVWPP